MVFADDAPSAEALATAIWAAQRLGAPVGVSGAEAQVASVVEALAKAGVRAEAGDGAAGPAGAVRLRWLAPDEGN